MEIKRDEIAQMQWTLVHKDFSGLKSQVNVLVAQLQDMKNDMEQQKTIQANQEERLRMELQGIIAKEKADREDGLNAMTNQLNSLVQNIHKAQVAQEIETIKHQKQMESAWDILDGEKHKRAADISKVREDLEGYKDALKKEETLRSQDDEKTLNEIVNVRNSCA